MPKAVVLGGNGVVGSAATRALVADGWQVVCSGRAEERFPQDLRAAGVEFARSDRYDPADLAELLSSGADVVVDCLAYTADHARMLLSHRGSIGSLVLLSSKAVYVDDRGRHSNSAHPPVFDVPVAEGQATLAPAGGDYQSPEGYGANKVAAEQVLLDSGLPVSVLRPSAIHGVGGTRPREWVFVRRVLDGRGAVLLAHGGSGANHPTAAVNLAALVALCAAKPGTRILNSADPDAPDGRSIARIVAAHLGHHWQEILLDDHAPEGLGDHPWNTLPPYLLDTGAARRLGFVPVGSYAETVTAEIDWLTASQRRGDPDGLLPAADDAYFARFFDYAREDAWLARSSSHHDQKGVAR